MSRVASVWASFWSDRDNRKTSVVHKLLFLFLVSFSAQSGGSVSGVYEIDFDDMEYHTGIPGDICRAILEGKKVTVKYEVSE